MKKHVITIEDFEDGIELGSTVTQISDEQYRDIEYLSRFTSDSYKRTLVHYILSVFYYCWLFKQKLRR